MYRVRQVERPLGTLPIVAGLCRQHTHSEDKREDKNSGESKL